MSREFHGQANCCNKIDQSQRIEINFPNCTHSVGIHNNKTYRQKNNYSRNNIEPQKYECIKKNWNQTYPDLDQCFVNDRDILLVIRIVYSVWPH